MATKREELAAFKLLKKHFTDASISLEYKTWDKEPKYTAISIDTTPGVCGDSFTDPKLAVLSLMKKGGKEL